MKKNVVKSVVACAALFTSSLGFSALSPYWDSVQKIEAVLSSPMVEQAIGGPIQSIEAREGLVYKVTSAYCSTEVQLNMHLPEFAGPTQYSVDKVFNTFCE